MIRQDNSVFSLQPNLYAAGSPVVVSSAELMQEEAAGGQYVQLRLHNISPKVISAVKVRIRPEEPGMAQLSWQYLDLHIPRDGEFGAGVRIPLPESAGAFRLTVDEVAFADGTLWQDSGQPWEPLKAPMLLVQVLKDWKLSQAYTAEVDGNCLYWPEEEKDLWRCGCGALNREGEDCHICGRSLFLFRMVDMDSLGEEKSGQPVDKTPAVSAQEEPISAEQPSAEPRAERKQKKHRPKGRRSGLIAALLVLCVVAAGLLLRFAEPAGNAGEQSAPTMTAPPAEPVTEEEVCYRQAQELEAVGHTAEAAIAYGKLAGYKDARERSFALWNTIAPRETLVAGGWHTVGVKNDGTVLAVGNNDYGQNEVQHWRDIISVCAAGTYTVGLKADGTVVAAGENTYGQCNVSGWTDIVAISASGRHTVGLKADGTVVATGDNSFGQCDVSGWTDVVQLSTFATNTHGEIFCYTAALRSDGTVVSAGENRDGWRDPVSGWQEIVSISTGGQHIVGLKSDGTVVAVGSDRPLWALLPSRLEVSGWRDVVDVQAVFMHTVALKADGTVVAVGNQNIYHSLGVEDWRDIVQISVKDDQTVGRRSDGTVVAIGWNRYGGCEVSGWTDIVCVRAGGWYTVGLKSDGTVVAAGWNDFGQCDVSDWRDIRLPG